MMPRPPPSAGHLRSQRGLTLIEILVVLAIVALGTGALVWSLRDSASQQLDEEAQFYLQARGIDKTTAKGLLLYAFAGEVLDKIEVDSLRNFIVAQIQERLGSKF